MCWTSEKPDPPPQPAVPPPPPPVLEAAAPSTAAPTASEEQNAAALGTKKYRAKGLAIDGSTGSTGTTKSGLGTTL